MAVSPITTIYTPPESCWKRIVTAFGTYTSAGATTAITITIDNAYPPIDRGIQSPVLGILMIADESSVAVGDIQVFDITGQVDRSSAPDSAGEFQITGDRTVKVYNTPDKDGKYIITYVAKGSGENV